MELEHLQDVFVDDEMEPNPRLNELTNVRFLKGGIKRIANTKTRKPS